MKVKKLNTQASPGSETAEKSFPIVALGASAGGLEALQGFFDHMPSDSGMAFVVIQHLNPAGKSLLGAILQKHTQMEVLNAEDEMRVERNHVYLNPAGKDVGIFNGVFQTDRPD